MRSPGQNSRIGWLRPLTTLSLAGTCVLVASMPVDALASGACCRLDRTCVVANSASACTSACGRYQGNGTSCQPISCAAQERGVTSLQLAGHALGTDPEDYPFFERVASFQTNESVEVTVDPSLVPGIMNKTCRIYVVDDKSKSEWMACPRPSLVDWTPDGYLLTTFSGTSVQQNVKLVAAAEDLSARSEPCYTVT